MTIVTTENLDDVRSECVAIDQRDELSPGCETWAIKCTGGQRGQMTIWPYDRRGAVCWGADSSWGDWDADRRILTLDSGEEVAEEGWSFGLPEDEDSAEA